VGITKVDGVYSTRKKGGEGTCPEPISLNHGGVQKERNLSSPISHQKTVCSASRSSTLDIQPELPPQSLDVSRKKDTLGLDLFPGFLVARESMESEGVRWLEGKP